MCDFIGTKLTMNLGERSYDIIVKSGSLENLYQFARQQKTIKKRSHFGLLVHQGFTISRHL